MKKMMMRLVLALFLLLACGSAPVLANGPGPVPLCYPGDANCPGN